MLSSALVSLLHLLGVALGLGAVFARGRALARAPLGEADLARALAADNVWGIAALLLLPTGFARAFTRRGRARSR